MTPLEKQMQRVELLISSRTCSNCIREPCVGKSNCIRPGGFHSHWLGEQGMDYEKEYLEKVKQ